LSTTHYIILMFIVCSAYWAVISLIDMLESKKRLSAKNKTWGKLNEASEKLKVEEGLKVWKSLGSSDKKKDIKYNQYFN
jgi:hypothetical protein